MFKFQGIWLPDGEKHFPEWMAKNGEIVNGRGTYQIRKLREAMKWCKQFRTAVDVGAHVGLWSMHLVQRFKRVEAFEPVPQFRECFRRNVPDAVDVTTIGMMGKEVLHDHELHDCALGVGTPDGFVSMNINPADTGGTHVNCDGLKGDAPLTQMKQLDSFCFQDVDFIKIDTEGYELEVLKGAVETLRRCKPCVIVEQKPHKLLPNFGIKGTPAVDFLRSLGAVLRKEMGGDYIMSWDA